TGATTCPYCEKPLPVSAPAGKSLRSCFITIFGLIMGMGLAVALYFAFPDFWRNLLTPQAKKEEPKKVQRTAETDNEALNSLYNRYLQVLENPEPEKFREFVQKGRLNELSDGGTSSLIYDQLVPDISMNGMGVDRVIVEGDRGIVVTQAQSAGQVTDNQGNPVGTIGIAKCIYEHDGWKIFSQTWHINSPTNPVEDSMSWLTPKTNNAAAAELLSLGVEYGDESCLDAISRKRSEVVKVCLKAGFGPNTPWMEQATAFDSAVSKIANGDEEDLEIIKAMLAAGANVDSKTSGALTPLMQASMHCKLKFAEVFINAGANVNFKNDQGLTPLVLAQNCPEVKELLEKHGAK
ncbi:ankyrin repeat domain-containing protein, partial [bacterium]|nr:ankyrin repeat domain-containing protein [bacterium]